MIRTQDELRDLLQMHGKRFPRETLYCERTIAWIDQYGDEAFVRENLSGHLTGSLLVMNPSRTRVLLMQHKKLGMWLQFGGHADGEIDLKSVALREFREESGIMHTPYLYEDIFDVHIHPIPARGHEPEHLHHDVVFLAEVPDEVDISYDVLEADDVRWFETEDIKKYIAEERMLRMMEKILLF